MSFGLITRLSRAVTRSITAENIYGEKGRGGMAGIGDEPQAEVTKIGQKCWKSFEARMPALRDALASGPGTF